MRVYGSTAPLINLGIKWRLSGQRQSPTTFQSGKMLLLSTEYEPHCTSEPVGALEREIYLVSAEDQRRSYGCPAHSLINTE